MLYSIHGLGPRPSHIPHVQHQPAASTTGHRFLGQPFVNTPGAVSMAAPFPASSPQWQPWMSPYPYEVVLLQNKVQKCYGCGNNFVDKYRATPFNLIIKHTDKRIAGKDSLGQLKFSVDFSNTYYHPILAHIQRKNPLFDGNVRISRVLYDSLDHGQHEFLSSLDLEVNIV